MEHQNPMITSHTEEHKLVFQNSWNAREPENTDSTPLAFRVPERMYIGEDKNKGVASKKPVPSQQLVISTAAYEILYQEYDKLIKAKRYSGAKTKLYQSPVREFLWWMETHGITDIGQTSQQAFAYYDYLLARPNQRRAGTLSDNTICRHFLALRIFFDYLLDTGQITTNIILPSHRRKNVKERNILTEEEIQHLFATCQNKRETAILACAYGMGMRRSELEKLNLGDIDWSKGSLVVRVGKGGKRRELAMSNKIIAYLKNYLYYERSDYEATAGKKQTAFFLNNWGLRMKGENMGKILKAIIRRSGNKEMQDKEISLHCLRHSIACHLIDRGASIEFVREFLGHVEINTTSIYARRRKRKENLLLTVGRQVQLYTESTKTTEK